MAVKNLHLQIAEQETSLLETIGAITHAGKQQNISHTHNTVDGTPAAALWNNACMKHTLRWRDKNMSRKPFNHVQATGPVGLEYEGPQFCK